MCLCGIPLGKARIDDVLHTHTRRSNQTVQHTQPRLIHTVVQIAVGVKLVAVRGNVQGKKPIQNAFLGMKRHLRRGTAQIQSTDRVFTGQRKSAVQRIDGDPPKGTFFFSGQHTDPCRVVQKARLLDRRLKAGQNGRHGCRWEHAHARRCTEKAGNARDVGDSLCFQDGVDGKVQQRLDRSSGLRWSGVKTGHARLLLFVPRVLRQDLSEFGRERGENAAVPLVDVDAGAAAAGVHLNAVAVPGGVGVFRGGGERDGKQEEEDCSQHGGLISGPGFGGRVKEISTGGQRMFTSIQLVLGLVVV